MDFRHSDKGLHWQERVQRFMDEKVLPRSADYWAEVRADHTVQPRPLHSRPEPSLPGDAHVRKR